MTVNLSIPAASNLFFKGRPGDPRVGDFVRATAPEASVRSHDHAFVLIGYPDDHGVRLNRGRTGAALGPDSIRRHLYKMAVPAVTSWDAVEFFDWGNIPVSDDILHTHAHAEKLAKLCIEKGFTGIFLGGGHDFAAPSFLGAVSGGASHLKWGLMNVDPHLDVRPWENNLPHSGTPFRTILDSGKLAGENFVEFGARESRNAREHWNYCISKNVAIDTWESIQVGQKRPSELFGYRLWELQSRAKRLAVTFDMDACADCEGTSAAPVLGFSAWQMVEMAGVSGRCREVSYIEIAEVAPSLESSERSSRIAAEMIHAFICGRAGG